MRSLTLAVSLALLFILAPVYVFAQSPDRKVLAAYYTWYGTPQVQGKWLHWDEAGHDPERLDGRGWPDTGTANHPESLYDSYDQGTIRRHLAIASKAGVDVLVTSWWGRGHYADDPFRRLLKEAEKTKVEACIYYETIPVSTDDPNAVAKTVEDFRYLLDSYALSSAYFKHQGVPVIFIYSRAVGQLSREQWTDVVKKLKTIRPVMLIADSRSMGWLDVFDSLHEYNPVMQVVTREDYRKQAAKLVDACRSRNRVATVTVIPGYDDSHIGRKVPTIAQRKEGNLYRDMWSAAISAGPDWTMICSFNGWHEGSEIEPSREHGDMFVALTSRYADHFKKASGGVRMDKSVSDQISIQVGDGLLVTAESLPQSGIIVRNLDSRPGRIKVTGMAKENLFVFEMGRQGKPYLQVTADKTAANAISWQMRPYTSYQIWTPKKLQALKKDPKTASDQSILFLSNQVSAGLCGVGTKLTMTYPTDLSGEYKICVDQPFEVVCTLRNSGKAPVKAALTRLSVPDTWKVQPANPGKAVSVPAGGNALWKFTVTAPVRSVYGPKYPVNAWWTLSGKEGTVKLHDSLAVSIVHPFEREASITASSPTEAEMSLVLKNNFPGRTLNDLEVNLDLPVGWTGEPSAMKLNLAEKAEMKFKLQRTETMPKELRVAAAIFKLGDYRGSKRVITDLYVPMGQYPRTAGLWMVDVEDGQTEITNIEGKACRKMVDSTPERPVYMYFGVSENIPVSGHVFVTVCYFDDGTNPFELQYDSTDPASGLDAAHKVTPRVQRGNTNTWKTHTFKLSDARFGGGQNGQADFRIAGSRLSVAWVGVSKFPVDVSQ